MCGRARDVIFFNTCVYVCVLAPVLWSALIPKMSQGGQSLPRVGHGFEHRNPSLRAVANNSPEKKKERGLLTNKIGDESYRLHILPILICT